nr:MAG TPA: hypothetical protein [Caudoviricetes sp.]
MSLKRYRLREKTISTERKNASPIQLKRVAYVVKSVRSSKVIRL